MNEPIWCTPESWAQIEDSELSHILDKIPWTVDREPAFCLYRLALNGQAFASAYANSGRIFCDVNFRIKEPN